jgi:hypothetical protein
VSVDTHACPIRGCGKRVPDYQLMCGRHWRLVHPNLQRRLYRAWARGAGAGSDEHAEAMRLCIEEVQHKLTEGTAR